jgi:hypothetical protein
MNVPLEGKIKADLIRALGHLDYSFKKISRLTLLSKQEWTEEDLEVLESFASRFARTSDLYLSQYLRQLILQKDPGFRGSFIDLLNLAEKTSLIDSATTWFRIRALRNVAAHDYVASDLKGLYQELYSLTTTVLAITTRL